MNLIITTHEGEKFETTVDEYNAFELNEKLNSSEVNTVALGDVILSRISVKSIKPIVSNDQIEENI